MASGKLSPRQKMINMMYLVLTALLALNVSKEVLNSFFEVNRGIENSTESFDLKNDETYSDFDRAVQNNPEKFTDVRDQAYSIKSIVDELYMYVQEMKYDLVSEVDKGVVYLGNSQEILDDKGKPKKELAIKDKKFTDLTDKQKLLPIAYLARKDNRYGSSDIFMPKTQAKDKHRATILKNKIVDYRDYAITLAGDNQTLIDKINVICDVSDRGSGKKKQSWEVYNFYDMPSVGALTLLSKIQLDIRNIEADLIDYLKKNIDSKSLKFADAMGIQIPESNFILSGDMFKAQIFVTAFNKDRNPDVYVGEYDSLPDGSYKMRGKEGVDYQVVPVENGRGIYEIRTGSQGPKKWGGLISMKTETGTKFYPFMGEYLVASKQGVASPTNMNVLFTMVNNPIKVAVPGYPASDIIVSLVGGSSQGTVSAINRNEGTWTVKPSFQAKTRKKQSKEFIQISVRDGNTTKLIDKISFKILDVPKPRPTAKNIPYEKNNVSRGQLLDAQAMVAFMGDDFYFDSKEVSFRVISYDVTFTNTEGTFTRENKGALFNETAKSAIRNTANDGMITISNIKVKRKLDGAPIESLPESKSYTITG